MTKYSYAIGTSVVGCTNVESLDTTLAQKGKCVAPRGLYVEPWSVYRIAANGLEVGDGFPRCTWHFDAIHNDQKKKMDAYLGTAQSAEVYIRTTKNDRTYGYYKCIMHRPKPDQLEPAFNSMWHNVDYNFTMLELQADP